MSRWIGIDEAGRGPVLGPLVMACVVLDDEQAQELERLGIRDSKKYGSGNRAKKARLQVRPSIYRNCKYGVVVYHASQVDEFVQHGRLDDLERQGARELLHEVGATKQDRIICDGAPIFSKLSSEWPNLRAENKADEHYVCVSAASILAKTIRDERMEEILKKYEDEFGPISGGGYVNKGTRSFLASYETKYGRLPLEARKTWKWRPEPDNPGLLQFLLKEGS